MTEYGHDDIGRVDGGLYPELLSTMIDATAQPQICMPRKFNYFVHEQHKMHEGVRTRNHCVSLEANTYGLYIVLIRVQQ